MNAREVVVNALRYAAGDTAQTHENHADDHVCPVCTGDPEGIADLVLNGLKRAEYAIIRLSIRTPGGHTTGAVVPADLKAAAELRVKVGEKLRDPAPEWVQRIAQGGQP